MMHVSSLVSLCGMMMFVCVFVSRSAGGCQKRLREDVGSDDRDFIKRMKGDFDHRLPCLKEFSQIIPIRLLSPLKHMKHFSDAARTLRAKGKVLTSIKYFVQGCIIRAETKNLFII